jgi:hypothetical protein
VAASKERYQNPALTDTLSLRSIFYNANNPADVASIDDISIYSLDPVVVSSDNPDGRVLIESLDVTQVVKDDTGNYHIDLVLTGPKYTQGRFMDVWTVTTDATLPDPQWISEQLFTVFPNKWYSTPIPVVYDFDFRFQPNRFRQGAKQYIRIEVKPNVPRASDLARYYENLAIAAQLSITIQQECGECIPVEVDLRTVVEDAAVSIRDGQYAYYQLDTTDLDVGIYNVWFKLDIGGNLYISPKMALQIFD